MSRNDPWTARWQCDHRSSHVMLFTLKRYTYVESGYNEHGYNEIPPIAKSFPGTEFSPVYFNIIKYGYNESGYSEITLITKYLMPAVWGQAGGKFDAMARVITY